MRTNPHAIARLTTLLALIIALAPTALAQQIGFGTAFFVNDHGDALTNAHVLRECDPDAVFVRARDGEWVPARILAIDQDFDLASLATGIATDAFAAVRIVFGTSTVSIPDPPEDIFTGGFDGTDDEAFDLQLRWGQVQEGLPPNEFPYLNVMRNASGPGSSGAPVLDYAGLLVGIILGGTTFPAVDLDGLSESGYGEKWVFIHNNNAIVQYANRTGLRINAWDRGQNLDPIAIARHLGNITVQVGCIVR
ncbi:MAG: serine protease [Trueperaceae bacterium]